MMVKEYKVEVRQFLTKANSSFPDKKPVPFRTMYGYIKRETENGVEMVLNAKLEASSVCMRCGRKITNPESIQFGLGSECISKVPGFPLVSTEELPKYLEELKEKAGMIAWTGWLPKGYITLTETGKEIDVKEEVSEQPKAEGLYPELSTAQNELIVHVRKKWLANKELLKPTEIWIDTTGNIKVVCANEEKVVCVKVFKDGERVQSSLPTAPKYRKIHNIDFTEKAPEVTEKAPEVVVDVALVNELVEEISCLLL